MSNTTILNLPVAIGLTGQEWIEIVQNGVSCRVQLISIAQFVKAMTIPSLILVSGQQTVQATVAALPSHNLSNGLYVKAAQTNTGPVYVGNSNVNTTGDGTGTGYRLDVGEPALWFAVGNSNLVYIIGNASDVVYFEGS